MTWIGQYQKGNLLPDRVAGGCNVLIIDGIMQIEFLF